MEEKIFDSLTYLISYPEGFQEDKQYPLVIFLHGAGSRSDTTKRLQKNFSLSCIRKRQDSKGFVLLAPLCSGITWNEWMTPLLHLVEHYRDVPYIDQTRIHLTGNSMGGYGTWALAALRADWFASAMPLSGGGSTAFAKYMGGLPFRAFHGLRDEIVDPLESMEMAKAVNAAGGYAELILFPQNKHDIWGEVYDDDKNYDWFLSFTNVREKTTVAPLHGNYYG